jgi:dihydroxy-acid dehydratase
MGTASTMACVAEVLGLALPQSATAPAVHANRLRIAEESGRAAARLIGSKLTPRAIVTGQSIENALRIILALSGSTNAVIHLTAIAARAGFVMTADDLNRLADETPTLVDLKPTGENYMEDFDAAGGLEGVLRELEPLLNLEAMTITGETLGQRIERRRGTFVDADIVRPRSEPIAKVGGLIGLSGSLAPQGALLKRAAATPTLLEHTGRAVVFSSLADLAARIDDPDLDVTPDDVLVLQNAGPRSPAAMPEAGYLPIPKKLARQGVTDMVRISDARMSGTAYGTIVLHVTPETVDGGPLALVRTGDRISLSASSRRLDLLVDEEELSARRASLPAERTLPDRGYDQLFERSILSAALGCDFDFLQPRHLSPLRSR